MQKQVLCECADHLGHTHWPWISSYRCDYCKRTVCLHCGTAASGGMAICHHCQRGKCPARDAGAISPGNPAYEALSLSLILEE